MTTIDRGLSVLSQFHQSQPHLSLTEIAAGLDCAVSSAMRILRTLEDLGFVEQDLESGNYSPGLQAIRLGYAAMISTDLHHAALPIMRDLFRRTGANVNLDVLIDDLACRVERFTTEDLLIDDFRIGTLIPAQHTASGRALLMCLPSAEIDALLRNRPTEAVGTIPLTPALLHQNLERDNSRGYVFAEQEFGLCVVAAPIFDSSDKTVAAVSVGWLGKPTSSASARRPYVEAVIAAAEEITTALKQVDNGPVE